MRCKKQMDLKQNIWENVLRHNIGVMLARGVRGGRGKGRFLLEYSLQLQTPKYYGETSSKWEVNTIELFWPTNYCK